MRVELGVSLGGLNLIKKNIGNGKKKIVLERFMVEWAILGIKVSKVVLELQSKRLLYS